MLVFNYHIEIGNYRVISFASVEIISSWESISDRCKIIMGDLKKKLESAIKVGDPITIKLGYNGELRTEFEGYVSVIRPNIPMEIECEDEAWLLKRENVTKSWLGQSKLADVINYLIPGVNLSEVQDVTLTDFKLIDVSKYKALEKLKEVYGLTVYFRNKKPFAGLAFTEAQIQNEIVNHSIRKNVIKPDLEFVSKEDVRLHVKAISIMPDNKKLEVEAGDPDGERRTLHFYNVLSEQALKVMAEEKLEKLKYDGYRGSMTTFGVPFVQHGYTSRLIDPDYPQREGSYYIDQVETTVSDTGGFKREISLGRRIA